MRPNPLFEVTDEGLVRALIAEHPWATIVSETDGGMVASHYPVLLDDRSDELALVTHMGRPDEQLHQIGDRELLVIFAGPSGYISPSWYSERDAHVPTWNFSVAHCYGIPQVLDADANLQTLARLVEHFERRVENPCLLEEQLGARMAPGTFGIRVPISRFVCKVKMSQNKDPESQRQILAALRRPGPYSNEPLARDMQRALQR